MTASIFLALLLVPAAVLAQPTPLPALAQRAPDIELSSIRGHKVRLSSLYAEAPLVLVVLRGFPGYQCPLCNRQVADFIGRSQAFVESGTKVVFVYPGIGTNLAVQASAFLEDKRFPEAFELLLDPDYKLTKLYGLRWEAPNETAYPSTMLIRQTSGEIFFLKTAAMHGGRTTATEMLALLPKRTAQ